MTVGEVLQKSEEELLALRNFGRKSYDELRVRLDELDLLSADAGGEEALPDAAPLGDADVPMRPAVPVDAKETPATESDTAKEAAGESAKAEGGDIVAGIGQQIAQVGLRRGRRLGRAGRLGAGWGWRHQKGADERARGPHGEEPERRPRPAQIPHGAGQRRADEHPDPGAQR